MQSLYGTTVLSSLAVVSAVDAVRVVAWYGPSASLSKGVVYFECAGIQAVTGAGPSTAAAAAAAAAAFAADEWERGPACCRLLRC